MILEYNFDTANPNGDKAAVIVPNVPTLVNKLSANEINNVRDKINEIIGVQNSGGEAVPYLVLRLKFKGNGNTAGFLEVGDVVQGFADSVTLWANATYNGGDPANRANYTPFVGALEFDPIFVVSNGLNDVIILPNGFKAKNVFLNKGVLTPALEWVQNDDAIDILGGLINLDEVLITT